MSFVTTPSVVRQLGSLFEGGSVAGLTDGQLIERFNDRRDAVGEAAFAALVARHGPMVLHVCRQLVGDRHHAEDAFQAVFLVLARKARSIRDPDRLGNWLYGVALRTARKARGRITRRRQNEEGDAMSRAGSGPSVAVEPMVEPAEQAVLAREQAEALYTEIDRLSGPFRQTVVLCYLEGLTLEEAARRLRCPAGTVRSRLARACDKLRRGLTRRGVSLSGAAIVAALSPRSASASVSSPLCDLTTRAAINFAAGHAAAGATSASAMALAREVLRSMLIHKLKFIGMALVFLGAVATGAGYLTHSLAMKDEPKKAPAGAQPRIAPAPDDATRRPAPGRMFVVGRVLDPQGQPIPGAAVMASARAKVSSPAAGMEGMSASPIGHGTAGESGRFLLDAARTSSSRHDELMAIAIAPGYGLGWAALDPDAEQPSADITLHPEQVIQGRLFDLQGRPVQGVVVSVSSIQRVLMRVSGDLDPRRRRSEGPYYWWARVHELPAWPRPATTDAEGRFIVHGVSRGIQAILGIIDPRFALQRVEVETDSPSGVKSVTMALQPAKIIIGRVTFADTGKPVPHARLIVVASGAGQRGGLPTDFQTDADGRFRANPSPGDHFSVSAVPSDGQPYLASARRFDWPKGAIEQSVNLALPRGVTIRGKVTEEGTDHPIAGAAVVFVPHFRPGENSSSGSDRSETAADGSFELAVAPRPGHLAVQAPTEDYVLRQIGNREFLDGLSGGRRLSSHAFIAHDPKPDGTGPEIIVALRKGVSVTGRIVGPDDRPVQDAWIFSQVVRMRGPAAWTTWRGDYHGNAFNGRFELHGLDPVTEVPVYFLEPNRKLGATAHLSGKSAASGPVTVQLQPCGTATARLVVPEGRPVVGYHEQYMISMKVTPGPEQSSQDPADAKRLSGEGDFLVRIDSVNYRKEPASDSKGRIAFPALIPGATYRIYDVTTRNNGGTRRIRKEFTVKPGETLDLGDILIEKPPTR